MPIYTFTCEKDGDFDKVVPYGLEKVACPVCSKKAARKGLELPARRNPIYGIQQ